MNQISVSFMPSLLRWVVLLKQTSGVKSDALNCVNAALAQEGLLSNTEQS
jgi:hypothetical protein